MQILDYVRHGETVDLYQGIRSRTDTPLNGHGEHQAQVAGEYIRRFTHQPNVILASPYLRTMQTACIIAQVIGYNRAIEPYDLIVERDWGKYTGKSNEWIRQQFDGDRIDFNRVPGAESLALLQQRAVKAWVELQERPEDRILVVGHGTFGRALLRAIGGMDESYEYSSESGSFKNGEVRRLWPVNSQPTLR